MAVLRVAGARNTCDVPVKNIRDCHYKNYFVTLHQKRQK